MNVSQRIAASIAGVLVTLGGAGLVVNAALQDEPATAAAPAVTNTAPEPAVSPSPTTAASTSPVPTSESPAPGPVVDIHDTDTMAFSDTLEPPSYQGVWRVVDPDAGYGNGPDDTTFLLAHARTPWRGHSPGNEWQTITVGDVVTVDGDAYTATYVADVPKIGIGDAPIWENVPGRVVLITCVPLLDGSTATHNRIVILEDAQ